MSLELRAGRTIARHASGGFEVIRRAGLILIVAVLLIAGAAIYRVETHSARPFASSVDRVQQIAAQPEPAGSGAIDVAKPSDHLEAGHKPKDETGRTNLAAAPNTAEGPLHSGETLEYVASIAKLGNVANLKLQVVDHKDFLSKTAWHLQAFAHTENPLRIMFALDDQFDSYSDAANFASLQYEMRLNERGQQVTSIQRMTVAAQEPAPAGISQTRVLPGTRDPLGMMQYLRTLDWQKISEVRGPVYDGHKLYDCRATLQGAENVTVPAGQYQASKIAIRVFDNGAELKDASFALYLANDTSHTPVLLEAVMPFANARVELAKAH